MEEEDLPSEKTEVASFIESMAPGPVLLFFGCRGDQDFLFEAELRAMEAEHTLTSLVVAKSREGPEKVYVTHKLREWGQRVCQLIMDEGAAV